MPIDKELSRPGAPVFGVAPEAVKEYAGVSDTPWVIRGALPDMPQNPNLSLVRNTQQDQIFTKKGTPKFGPTGFLPILYRPGGLLYRA